jgi:hypothetical protein
MVRPSEEPDMKLFFETAAQASLFLATIPLGFGIAVLIDLAGRAGTLKPLWDVLAMLTCFGSLAFTVVLLGDGGLRVYHLLSVLIGALLYRLGLRSLLSAVCSRIRKLFKKDAQDSRNIKGLVE